MLVKCIDNCTWEDRLTLNKTYEVLSEINDCSSCKIIADNNIEGIFSKKRFVEIIEDLDKVQIAFESMLTFRQALEKKLNLSREEKSNLNKLLAGDKTTAVKPNYKEKFFDSLMKDYAAEAFDCSLI